MPTDPKLMSPGDIWALADASGFLLVKDAHRHAGEMVVECFDSRGGLAIFDAERMLPGAVLVLRHGQPACACYPDASDHEDWCPFSRVSAGTSAELEGGQR